MQFTSLACHYDPYSVLMLYKCIHTILLHTSKILDGPGAPEGVEVSEIPDDRRSSSSCVLTLQLNHPSDVDSDEIPHLIYLVDYQSQRDVITAASYTFIVQNCTQELSINVTTVNRCGSMGGSVVNIVPTFLPVSVSVAQGPNVGM